MEHTIDHGKYEIYLTGSRKHIWRNVYEDETGRTYIVWYNQIVEVIKGHFGYYTKEAY